MPYILRTNSGQERGKVGFVELFLDLIYVYAVTQISHNLITHFSYIKLLETIFLIVAIWWVWMYTTWAMNWLNPLNSAVRFMLFFQMFGGLILGVAIPEAFEQGALPFAITYSLLQVTRSLFSLMAMDTKKHIRNFQRVTCYLVISSIFWLSGAYSHEYRYALWGVALSIEFAGPLMMFLTPWLGATKTKEWDIRGEHMAERCGLFVIIALGESLLVTGATFEETTHTSLAISTLIIAFISTVTMWWIYFSLGQEHAAERMRLADDPGKIGRIAYTYLHIPIIMGIILTAVSDEILLLHPLGHHGHTTFLEGFVLVGGPYMFLVGNLFFKKIVFGQYPRSHIFGLLFLSIPSYYATVRSPLWIALCVMSILVAVGIMEHRANNRYKRREGYYD